MSECKGRCDEKLCRYCESPKHKSKDCKNRPTEKPKTLLERAIETHYYDGNIDMWNAMQAFVKQHYRK